MPSPYSISHRGVERFALAPEDLWTEVTDARRFERWWSWLQNMRVEPDRIETGSRLSFSIVSPLPYQMRCIVDLEEVVENRLIRTVVSGDLKGWANLEIEPDVVGSKTVLEWELEPTQTAMRVLVRAARPLILRTKDWAIDIALSSFRRNVGA